jgi:hypothetical protein
VDAKFLSAVYAIPPIVLGKQLKPFCCGHAQSLYAIQSPFMIGGQITKAELLTAVWLCSMSSEDGRTKLLSSWKDVEEEAFQWGKSIVDWDIKLESEKFEEYLNEYIKSPATWKKADHREAKSPWSLRVIIILMRELKMSRTEAEDMPLPMALWYIATINDLNGDNSLISESEQERLRLAKEMAAKHV